MRREENHIRKQIEEHKKHREMAWDSDTKKRQQEIIERLEQELLEVSR